MLACRFGKLGKWERLGRLGALDALGRLGKSGKWERLSRLGALDALGKLGKLGKPGKLDCTWDNFCVSTVVGTSVMPDVEDAGVGGSTVAGPGR